MTREEAIEILKHHKPNDFDNAYEVGEAIVMAIKALEQEPKTRWNNHQIACMLADLFGDACACNYNGIDEWLGELCDFKDTCCPNPVGVACWEQFLKYSQSRYTECGYEVRDKNALQEPKTGHWIPVSERLPEKEGRYLTTIFNEYDNELRYIMACDYFPNGCWCPDDECASRNVIAWMPLPKPYEPQESEE